MFQLTAEETKNWISQIVISNPGARMGVRKRPYAFTEHGVAMLSSVLKSDRAVEMNIFIIRAFIKLREVLATNKVFAQRIEQLERTQRQHGTILVSLVEDIQKLKRPSMTRAVGFVYPKPKKK